MEIIMKVVEVARIERILDHSNFSDSSIAATVPTAASIIDSQIFMPVELTSSVK